MKAMDSINNENHGPMSPKTFGIRSTAEGMALYRAIESKKDEESRICYDPYAIYFIQPKISDLIHSKSELLSKYMAITEEQYPGLSSSVLARTRFYDDIIIQLLDDGLDQFVILGAGYDSRALRIKKLKSIKKVFELDHCDTQSLKRELLSDLSDILPQNLTFISIDFEKNDLFKILLSNGFNPALKTLFLMEGLIYYLSAETVNSTLSSIANQCRSDWHILFDYPCRPAQGIMIDQQKSIEKIREHIRDVGEQFKFLIPGGDVNQYLKGYGFSIDQNLSGFDLKNKYFTGINACRKVSPLMSVVLANISHHKDNEFKKDVKTPQLVNPDSRKKE